MPNILYSFVRCPYAMRARMALIESGINCILREVNLRDKPLKLIEASPKGTVPVLILDDGRVIEESLDIILYATGGNMGDEERDLVSNNDSEFVKLSRIYKYPDRYPDESAEECRHKIEELFLSKYEQMLENSNFLLEEKSVADIALLPFIRQFAKVDEDWFFNSKYTNIIRWIKSFTETEAFKNIVMRKHQPWKEGDEEIWLL